jgi:hypothetical protein
VLRLRGVSYHWKPEFKGDARPQIGFIAQEVEAVLPELVNTDEQGFKSVAYANAVPVLVEAIKEQQRQLDALKTVQAENAELKAKSAALETQLHAILTRLEQLEQAGVQANERGRVKARAASVQGKRGEVAITNASRPANSQASMKAALP